MSKTLRLVLIFIIAVFCWFSLGVRYYFQEKIVAISNSFYDVAKDYGDGLQLRNYHTMNTSSVKLEGDRQETLKQGFQMNKDYIFGENKSGLNIPMTSPVLQKKLDEKYWWVAFVMPLTIKTDDLPQPKSDKVILGVIEPFKALSYQFLTAQEPNFEAASEKIKFIADSHKLKLADTPYLAYYSPPWEIVKKYELIWQLEN